MRTMQGEIRELAVFWFRHTSPALKIALDDADQKGVPVMLPSEASCVVLSMSNLEDLRDLGS